MSLKSVMALLETKALRRYIQGRNALPGWKNYNEVPAFSVYQSVQLPITDNNYWYKVGFNTIAKDNRGTWIPTGAATNSSSWSIPETGLYLIQNGLRFDFVASNVMVKSRLMNQGGELCRMSEERVSTAGPYQTNNSVLIWANAGDVIRVEYVTEAGNTSITGGAAYTFFKGVRLN
jgi:hypothetical protein